jgi:hypothetical protein
MMWSNQARRAVGTPKLYIGVPMTSTSADRNSAISSSESDLAPCSDALVGVSLTPATVSVVRWGTGRWPRSRRVTVAAGLARSSWARVSSTSWRDTLDSPDTLLSTARMLFMAFSCSARRANLPGRTRVAAHTAFQRRGISNDGSGGCRSSSLESASPDCKGGRSDAIWREPWGCCTGAGMALV